MLTRNAVAIALVVGAATACGGSQRSATADPRTRVTVHVAHLAAERRAHAITLPGELRAFQEVRLFAKIPAFVRSLYADRGTVVQRGAVLVRLEASEIAAQTSGGAATLQAARATLQEAQARADASADTYRRLAQAAQTSGVVAPDELERARSTAIADSARLAAARSQAAASDAAFQSVRDVEDYLTIRAPFSGVVTQRGADSGAFVGPNGQAVFVMAEDRLLRLVVALPEAQASAQLGPGADPQATFHVRSLPGVTFTAMLSRRAHALDEATRTEALEFDVPNTDGRLTPGMYADVVLHASPTGPAYYVAASAVSVSTQGTFVMRVSGDTVEWVPVARVPVSNDSVQVIGDLRDGDRLVVPATEELARGTHVFVAEDTRPVTH